ncbi:hypothetical protein [Variovorax sp. 38R]|uniref:hypothetical protein n=1 Tax=Variovorax sp. 38R TaxID=2774875 RepID=UPI00178466D3|nr:hypothetical protein [Variovorax sp. 38R]QOF80450.1 hypothetical protein IG196_08745 [Variovorax sp. 38R]
MSANTTPAHQGIKATRSMSSSAVLDLRRLAIDSPPKPSNRVGEHFATMLTTFAEQGRR